MNAPPPDPSAPLVTVSGNSHVPMNTACSDCSFHLPSFRGACGGVGGADKQSMKENLKQRYTFEKDRIVIQLEEALFAPWNFNEKSGLCLKHVEWVKCIGTDKTNICVCVQTLKISGVRKYDTNVYGIHNEPQNALHGAPN